MLRFTSANSKKGLNRIVCERTDLGVDAVASYLESRSASLSLDLGLSQNDVYVQGQQQIIAGPGHPRSPFECLLACHEEIAS